MSSNQYSFTTAWILQAPIDTVWDALHEVERWPDWWTYVASVVKLEAGDQDGIGSLYRHTWRTRLPYNLVFDLRTARLERPHLIEATTAGELEGTGRWQLSSTPARTRAVNEWRVRTAKSWMNLVAPIARPVFAWNHAALMRSGRLDLQRLLDERMVAQGGRPDQVI